MRIDIIHLAFQYAPRVGTCKVPWDLGIQLELEIGVTDRDKEYIRAGGILIHMKLKLKK